MEDESYWDDDGRNEEQSAPSSSSSSEKGPLRLPLYAQRHPPLVQPLETSAFAERTFGTFGIRDLGHEWVTLFQTIGEGNCGGYSKSMKLHVPDTILLSPSGLPSMWYSTSASSHIKPRNLMRVTPQSILEALTSASTLCGSEALSEKDVVAIRRVGFQVESLTLRELKEFCHQMERPRVVVPRQEWEEEDEDNTDDEHDSSIPPTQPRAFCLQRHIARDRDVSFLTLWRCKHRKKDPKAVCDNVTDAHYARSFYKRPLPLLTSDISSKCDLFLVSHPNPRRNRTDGGSKSVNARTAEEDEDENESESGSEAEREASKDARKKPQVLLTHLDLEFATLFEDSLRAFGFDEDVILPQLCHMKLTASEILNRLNRGLQARQASGILCEFFVGAKDKRVYFSGLAGTHWEGSEPSWEKLSQVDAISRAIAEFLAHKKKSKQQSKSSALTTTTRTTSGKSSPFAANAMFPGAFHAGTQYSDASLGEGDSALKLYNELNPRFPSVESPYVSEQQWRFQSPLLPPDVSPRYIGAQVPKSYRDGKFHSLLTPKQADSVNRLNLSPRPPVLLHVPPRGSLSKQYAKLQQLAVGHSGGLGGNGTRRPTLSPRKLNSAMPMVGTESARRAPQ